MMHQRTMHLALLKMGFDWTEIRAMPEGVVETYLTAYRQARSPKKQRTYKIKRKRGNNG